MEAGRRSFFPPRILLEIQSNVGYSFVQIEIRPRLDCVLNEILLVKGYID